ncbi:hypothetical protein K402DRAFT_89164 [Aulographum hederae CBS 113979]|uniref:Secreted protein n=1 Tax=Aulographum hederae CBS 113979 TaxID=1176131 RepID=A0A6G1GZN8_9PEZI|nr:hypothetical protein K402DRAFT_89164 [Aulographum hederae CBS 113979]
MVILIFSFLSIATLISWTIHTLSPKASGPSSCLVAHLTQVYNTVEIPFPSHPIQFHACLLSEKRATAQTNVMGIPLLPHQRTRPVISSPRYEHGRRRGRQV